MALVILDRAKVTTTTAGTGALTLGAAAFGFQSFADVGDDNTTYYAIASLVESAWEVGIGTYSTSGPTLARTTVLASSNSGELVDFAVGGKEVLGVYPASALGLLAPKVEGVQVITGTTPTLTTSAGAIKTWTLTDDSTLALTLTPGEALTLHVTLDSHALTLPNVRWPGGIAPTLHATDENVIEFWAVGASVYGAYVGAFPSPVPVEI